MIPGSLFIVATPIGNLSDLTLRAIDTLRSAETILCEDTRHTRILLTHYGIQARLLSLHEHNERARAVTVVERVQAGANVAYVSDAGTPAVSDPGARLVDTVTNAGLSVVPIPGPSSVTALLSVSGLPADRFVFEGFLPPKSGQRRKRLEALARDTRTLVIFESPFRIARTLGELLEVFGERKACLGRELTKKFEEIRREPLSALSAWSQSKTMRGEFVLAIEGSAE